MYVVTCSQNRTSLGICLIGRERFSWPQITSLHARVQQYRVRFGHLPVEPHSANEPELGGTACPGRRLGSLFRAGYMQKFLELADPSMGGPLVSRVAEGLGYRLLDVGQELWAPEEAETPDED